jgi:hypothetical protein
MSGAATDNTHDDASYLTAYLPRIWAGFFYASGRSGEVSRLDFANIRFDPVISPPISLPTIPAMVSGAATKNPHDDASHLWAGFFYSSGRGGEVSRLTYFGG